MTSFGRLRMLVVCAVACANLWLVASASAVTPLTTSDNVRRRDGALVRFDPKSGYFGVMTREGTIKTFFRPEKGFRYFKNDVLRP